MDTVARRIKSLRQLRRWTQVQLAKKVNVSPQVVSNWEREYTYPDHADIARLSEIFQTSADYILCKTDDPTPNLPSSSSKHSDLSSTPISIEQLREYKLMYKGHILTQEETEDLISLLEVSLKRWKT